MGEANKKYRQFQRHQIQKSLSEKNKVNFDKDDKLEQIEPANINTKEMICKYCGFKTRYKFLRCPECNREQEVQK